jgi:hypothetical protein
MRKKIVNHIPATDMVADIIISVEFKNLLSIAKAGEAMKEWRQVS